MEEPVDPFWKRQYEEAQEEIEKINSYGLSADNDWYREELSRLKTKRTDALKEIQKNKKEYPIVITCQNGNHKMRCQLNQDKYYCRSCDKVIPSECVEKQKEYLDFAQKKKLDREKTLERSKKELIELKLKSKNRNLNSREFKELVDKKIQKERI